MAMTSFFKVLFAGTSNPAIARASYNPELHKSMAYAGYIGDWKPLYFTLGEGTVEDYSGNNYAFRLCSERLRDILEGRRAAIDKVQWLAAPVTDTQGRVLPYSILHFTETPEVIDRTKSMLAGPVIVKPCLNHRLVGAHRVFSLPEDTVTLIISDEVKQAIEDAGCTGMGFSRIPIV
jgi:hypothetical protein